MNFIPIHLQSFMLSLIMLIYGFLFYYILPLTSPSWSSILLASYILYSIVTDYDSSIRNRPPAAMPHPIPHHPRHPMRMSPATPRAPRCRCSQDPRRWPADVLPDDAAGAAGWRAAAPGPVAPWWPRGGGGFLLLGVLRRCLESIQYMNVYWTLLDYMTNEYFIVFHSIAVLI